MIRFLREPKTLLLFDAFGAAVTASCTWFLLANGRIVTGLPSSLLQGMAIAAACFALFDLAAVFRRLSPALALRIIAVLNASYGLSTLVVLGLYHTTFTSLALAYFAIEISILLPLAFWEWRIASLQPHGSGVKGFETGRG